MDTAPYSHPRTSAELRLDVLGSAISHLDPKWQTSDVCKTEIERLCLAANAVLDGFDAIMEQIEQVEEAANWAATVEARGDEAAAGDLYLARYGGDLISEVLVRLQSY